MPTAGSSAWTQKVAGTITGSVRAANPQQDISYSDK